MRPGSQRATTAPTVASSDFINSMTARSAAFSEVASKMSSLNGSLPSPGGRIQGGMELANRVEYLRCFKAVCIRRYQGLCRTWRRLLDPTGSGVVSFVPFCEAARLLGFQDVLCLWNLIDLNRVGYITLEEWEPVAFRNLIEFRDICLEQYGSLDLAFKYGIDLNKTKTMTLVDLQRFCEQHEFTGDLHALFAALDLRGTGLLTLQDLRFLERWEFEKRKLRKGRADLSYGCRSQRLQMRRPVPRQRLSEPRSARETTAAEPKERGRPEADEAARPQSKSDLTHILPEVVAVDF